MINMLDINRELPQVMWIDLNSAFATIEQQAHPDQLALLIALAPNVASLPPAMKLKLAESRLALDAVKLYGYVPIWFYWSPTHLNTTPSTINYLASCGIIPMTVV